MAVLHSMRVVGKVLQWLVAGGRLRVEFVVAWKKAIWSLRLRLHSGLRQQGRAFGPGLYLGLRPRLV